MSAPNPIFAHEEREASVSALAKELQKTEEEMKKSKSRPFYMSPITPTERRWREIALDRSRTQSDKVLALLDDEVLWEKRKQRQHDVNFDHPIALYTRQKYQSKTKILIGLFMLTLIHLIQIGAMYNLSGLSYIVLSNDVAKLIERGDWVPTHHSSLFDGNTSMYDQHVSELLNGSETSLGQLMHTEGFCLSPDGYWTVTFNVGMGLFLVYMFIFADLWRVIFGTTITKSFPNEPNFGLIQFGAFWLVLLNSIVLAWLGVESGFSVVSSAGEFSTVLYNSLANFIILQLDDEVLPLVRFVLEEAGHLDHEGWLSREQLDLLTHGNQYYKPGYGQNWIKTIRHGPSLVQRMLAMLNIPVTLSIIVAPLGVVIHAAIDSYVTCPPP